VPQTVDLLKIKGKFLRKETFVNTTGDQSEKANEKEYEPELVQNATWCNKLSQFLYREWHNRPTIQLTLSELQKAKEYKVGKKVELFIDAEDIQNRMVIHEIVERYSQNTAKVKLKLKYDAGNSFVPDAKPEIIKRPSNQPNIPDIEKDITTINQTLANIANDNKLTPDEKKIVRTEWQRIQNEYTSLSNQATAYAITYSNYTTQYNALNTYLTGLNLTADTTEDIVRATFETKFDNYYVEKEALVKKIQDRIHDEGTKDFVGATDPNDNFSPLPNGTIWHDTGTNTLKKWDTNTSSWVILRSNYNIGNIKMQGDNLYAGTIKSNALLSDGTTPVSRINVDDGTFKFGDDVSANPKYIKYDSNGNLIIKGGQLEATNAMLWSDTDISVTVGTNGDFATLNEALEFMSKFMIIKRADGSRLHGNIYLLSGYEQTEQLSFYDVNLNWVTITSEDINVNVSFSASSIIYAVNSILPKFEIHFDFNNNNFPSPFGFCYLENSFIQIGVPNSVNKFGFSNAQSYGFMVLEEGSKILTYGSTFENIDGIKLQNSKVISKNLKYLNNRNEILCDYNSYVDLGNTDFTGTISSNIIANNLSIVNANSCIFNSSVSPNVEVNGGSQINVTDSTGVNGNIPVNTIDRKGIIFDEGVANNFANQTDITNKRDFISVSRTTYGVTPTNIEAENYMNTNYSSYPVGTMAQLSHTDSGNTTYFYMIKMSSGWNYLKSDI
jgi:hypothetical protein